MPFCFGAAPGGALATARDFLDQVVTRWEEPVPLLLCPNCNTSMQNVARSGVELDICPSCRGVWLDRGELEKLLAGQREDHSGQQQDRERFDREVRDFHRDPEDWKRRHP